MVSSPPQLMYTVQQVADLLQISRSSAFGLIRSGELDSCKVGEKLRRVSHAQLKAYLDRISTTPAA